MIGDIYDINFYPGLSLNINPSFFIAHTEYMAGLRLPGTKTDELLVCGSRYLKITPCEWEGLYSAPITPTEDDEIGKNILSFM